jgi:hypothetical protein
MATSNISGNLIGQNITPDDGRVVGLIVHVESDFYPDGPAENAYVYIDTTNLKALRAQYISWINLYDIENAAKREAGCWRLVEPNTSYNQIINWIPYGWGDLGIPSVADVNM